MAIIPVMRARAIDEAIAFYTQVLDFHLDGVWPGKGDPAFAILKREGAELHLDSHRGNGVFGHAVVVTTRDANGLWQKFLARGFAPPNRPESPVHCGPTDQTWGTREFYIDDPSGNTLCFIQR